MNEKTKFGFTQITNKTPQWAVWLFRIVFILTGIATFVIAGDPHFNPDFKIRAAVYLKGADMAIYAFSKMFGIPLPEDQQNTPQTPAP